jgi:hypothetical protein
LKPIEIPSKNIHIVDFSKLTPEEAEKINAIRQFDEDSFIALAYNQTDQSVISYIGYEQDVKMRFAQLLAHEMLHFNSFASFDARKKLPDSLHQGSFLLKRVEEDRNETKEMPYAIQTRRGGLNMFSPKSGKIYLHDLDEALVQTLTHRFDREFFGSFPEFSEEHVWRERFLEQVSEEEKTRNSLWERLSYVETCDVDEDGKRFTRMFSKRYGYQREMGMLEQLIDDLYANNKEEFSSREEIFLLIMRASFTGRMLPFARLMDKTYGKGSFRTVAEATSVEWNEKENE